MRRAGFTLLEALVVLLLLLILLGLLGQMVQQYSNVNRSTSEKDQVLESVSNALRCIRSEAQGATRFDSPAAGAPGAVSVLRFERPDPSASRLPDPLPTSLPGSWQPVSAPDLIEIEYRLDRNGRLQRQVTKGGSSESFPVVEGVTGFSAQHVGARLLEVQFSVAEKNRVIPVRTRVYLPLGRQ